MCLPKRKRSTSAFEIGRVQVSVIKFTFGQPVYSLMVRCELPNNKNDGAFPVRIDEVSPSNNWADEFCAVRILHCEWVVFDLHTIDPASLPIRTRAHQALH
jgi:hypothetical protein